MKYKFNVWKFDSEVKNTTSGWEYFVTITLNSDSEERARMTISREYNVPLFALKAYPHIDNMSVA